ncbi:uncharacterized protein LAESUDRAFT_718614 [Laetiporus sulphureus 93-53]|uniref:Uncharacterized protein n=1 Tax=Laetiporus sulphureus 93-53 TaxID=1314785 RepID=A0A165ARZ6_9APHY|nr:uncharacterized protein LAESUDRAFT_718614 [Laetiporus sulphureus 93-53]KZS99544.1 hypothetical protein LAESUDRAFT_718614 [Laetiporus sulphureus 93-53]
MQVLQAQHDYRKSMIQLATSNIMVILVIEDRKRGRYALELHSKYHRNVHATTSWCKVSQSYVKVMFFTSKVLFSGNMYETHSGTAVRVFVVSIYEHHSCHLVLVALLISFSDEDIVTADLLQDQWAFCINEEAREFWEFLSNLAMAKNASIDEHHALRKLYETIRLLPAGNNMGEFNDNITVMSLTMLDTLLSTGSLSVEPQNL